MFCKSALRENTVVPAPRFLQVRFLRQYCPACAVFCLQHRSQENLLCLRRVFVFCKSIVRESTVAPEPFFFANPFFEEILLCLRRFCGYKLVFRETIVVPALLFLFANPFFEKILLRLRRFLLCKSFIREHAVVPARVFCKCVSREILLCLRRLF